MLLFFIIATTAAATDFRKHRIPDACCVAIVFTSAIGCVTMPQITPVERLFGGVIISVPMFLLALCFRGSFGGGDVKFMAACGLFLGWEMILDSVVYAIGAAGIYAAVLLMKGCDRRTHFPLGPFLLFGMIMSIIMIKTY